MSNAASAPQSAGRGSLPAALASLAVGAGFLALWFWLLPTWMGFQRDAGIGMWRWLGIVHCSARFCRGHSLYVGLRMVRPRNSFSWSSSAAAGCG